MNNIKLYIIIIFCTLFMFSCGGKNDQIETSPDINNSPDLNNGENGNNYDLLQDSAVEKNMPEIIEDLRMDIKKMKAELDYQHENLSKLEAQTQVWANPFAIYNKEVVLNNGSSIFGKIVYQDQDVMKIETLIGQLIIDRNTIIRVVNQVNAYGNFDNESSDNQSGNSPDPSGVNLIQKRVTNMSAHLVLVGDITEEKDGSGKRYYQVK